jgi:transglutaminase-like putative cysteine protease
LDADVRPRALELVNEAQDDAQFARHLRVRVHVMRAYRDVGELSRRTKTRAVNGIFQLTDLTQLSSSDRPRPSDKQSSFVVDFDEPALREPADELHREDPAISARAVAAFVDRYIAKKTYTHGFDVASRVADSRAGDCTEHAVLTAALLRRFDHPARLVFGIALVGLANPGGRTRILAAGHAWVEEYDGSSWRIVDAALNPGGGTRARTGVPGLPEGGHIVLAYLPITVMRDETPGFSRALMDEAGVDAVVGLELDAVPDEALPTDAAPSDAH